MGQLLEYIFNFLQTVGQFLWNLINGIIQMLYLIPQAMGFLGTAIAYIPPVVGVTITALISVSVVYLIIGR